MITIIKFIQATPLFHSPLFQSCDILCTVSICFHYNSFIPVTVSNMSKRVELWSKLTSTSATKVYSFFVIGFSLFYHFQPLVFFFFVLSSSCGTLPFSSLYCSPRMEHWPFSFPFCFWSSSFTSDSWCFGVE